MLLQEAIDFTEYYRCYYLGGRIKIMQYEPRNPHHLRYVREPKAISKKLNDTMVKYLHTINEGLGYDFNTVEFAIRDGIPYAIDFGNPAPDADINSVGEENFEWVVENAALLAIERAKAHKEGQTNLTWGKFMQQSVGSVKAPAKSKAAPKAKPASKATKITAKAKPAAKQIARKAPAKSAKPAGKPRATKTKK